MIRQFINTLKSSFFAKMVVIVVSISSAVVIFINFKTHKKESGGDKIEIVIDKNINENLKDVFGDDTKVLIDEDNGNDEETIAPKITFLPIDDSGSKITYGCLDDALEAINKLKSDKISLKITFNGKAINEAIGKDKFRSWLARVGDYIFARRMEIVEDLEQVIKNAELARTNSDDVDRYGCALFSENADDWSVEIRGLSGQVEEVRKVAGMIIKAATESSKINYFEGFITNNIGDYVDEYINIDNGEKDKNNQRKPLNKAQRQIINGLLHEMVYDRKFEELKIKSNRFAFLALTDFAAAPNIRDNQKVVFDEAGWEFFDGFDEKVLTLLKEDLAEQKDLKELQKRTEEVLKITKVEIYGLLRTWVKSASVATILEGALFKV